MSSRGSMANLSTCVSCKKVYYSIAHAEDAVAAKQAALDQAQRNLDVAR